MRMRQIRINDKISYISSSKNPLSAEVGIIRDNGRTILYDVGNGEGSIPELPEGYSVVISHFHPDHTGNIEKMSPDVLYVSAETYKHLGKGIIVSEDMRFGNIHVFPLPSSHSKGCLGLEVDDTYAFIGDALYCKTRKNGCTYNVQLLKSEIDILKELKAKYLLVSHWDGYIREKTEVIGELEAIYKMRDRNSSEIVM
ncbi:MAG: MBL fold metallo-hydrolase [Lachnospiraceae bacterium]|nr:MBL fold metallo-hydrolase [Lachnospiraceae bacterium]